MAKYIYIFSMLQLLAHSSAIAETVNLTSELPYVDIQHNNKVVRIERNQDVGNIIDLEYALTSRPCPPYCIQPMVIAEGVETIAELELIKYLKQKSDGNQSVLVIDSREEKWVKKGMIPGAINIPWTQIYYKTSSQEKIIETLTFYFDAIKIDALWNFENAKILVFYCNGPWCGQSPTNIRALLNLGYPANKIKWYRGGMQSWQSLGLTTVDSK